MIRSAWRTMFLVGLTLSLGVLILCQASPSSTVAICEIVKAIKAGNLELVKKAIGEGVDPNSQDSEHVSLLMRAIAFKQASIAKYLLSKGADPRAVGNEGVVSEAALYKEYELVKLLVEAGGYLAPPKCPGRFYDDVLAECVDNTEMLRYLLAHGADPRHTGDLAKETALHIAAAEGNVEALKLLMDHGADLEQRDFNGWNALIYACRKDQKAAVEFLLANGADPSAKDKGGRTAATLAREAHHDDIASICAGNRSK